MARFFLLCLSAACCCCLAALLLPPVQGRPGPVTGAGSGRDDRLRFPEPHFDAAQQGGVAMKKATLSSRSLPAPAPMATAAGGVVTPELRTVPGGDANPSHGSIRLERNSPAEAAAAGSAARPELRTTPWGSNPLHNR